MYPTFYATLYKGLQHPWILVSVREPRTYLSWILRENCSYVFGESKVIHGFPTVQGLVL